MEELARVIRDCRNYNCSVLVVVGESRRSGEVLIAVIRQLHPCSLRRAMECDGVLEAALRALRQGSFLMMEEFARGSSGLVDQTEGEDVGIRGNGTWRELDGRDAQGARSDEKTLEKGCETSALHVVEVNV